MRGEPFCIAGTLDFKPSCSYDLLFEQLVYMRGYMRILIDGVALY